MNFNTGSRLESSKSVVEIVVGFRSLNKALGIDKMLILFSIFQEFKFKVRELILESIFCVCYDFKSGLDKCETGSRWSGVIDMITGEHVALTKCKWLHPSNADKKAVEPTVDRRLQDRLKQTTPSFRRAIYQPPHAWTLARVVMKI